MRSKQVTPENDKKFQVQIFVPLDVFLWLLTFKMVRVELYVQNKCIFEKLSENRPHLQPKGNEVLIPQPYSGTDPVPRTDTAT